MDSFDSHYRTRQSIDPTNQGQRSDHGEHFVIRPLKKTSSIVMVASTAVAIVDLVRALAGIYTYALYRHTVDRLSKRFDE